MLTKDKYFIGFLSGLIAVIPMDILDYLNYLLLKAFNYQHILYADYAAAALLQGHASHNLFEFISGQIFHIMHSGIVGSIYVFMLYIIKEDSNIFKGWFCGVFVWFLAFLSGVFFKVHLFVEAEMHTVISDLLTSSLFGILLAVVYNKLGRKYIID